MSPQQRHRDVAAYALGVLEPADTFRFEEHLADCVLCAVRLTDFARVASVLSPYAGPRATEPLPLGHPSADLLDRLLDEVAALRARLRGKRLRLIAVAAALIIAAPAGAVALQGTADPAGVSTVSETSGTVTDPATGVTAAVSLVDRAWGTDIGLRLGRVAGPQICELVAVGRDGSEETVTTWSVPVGGYGNPGVEGHEAPLITRGATSLARADIDHFVIRTTSGRHLVTVDR
ncbi:anti-sigma factor family protein [Streptomyces sp. NPDC058001]|uniref:anti-sigma factor family protein n=1 Tax=Streptomyces sp. NPDC058001 TaxID=3346300 RepID=UPI0036DFB171